MRDHLQMIGVDRLTARLQICIDPDGSTQHVRLLHGSGVSYFDRAVVADLSSWRREPSPSLHGVCEPITLTYVP
jgi:TonB family protein